MEKFRQNKVHRLAHSIAAREFPAVETLTGAHVADFEQDRKGRKRMLRSLQERLQETLGEERRDILQQLHSLEAHQFASRMVVERRLGKRF